MNNHNHDHVNGHTDQNNNHHNNHRNYTRNNIQKSLVTSSVQIAYVPAHMCWISLICLIPLGIAGIICAIVFRKEITEAGFIFGIVVSIFCFIIGGIIIIVLHLMCKNAGKTIFHDLKRVNGWCVCCIPDDMKSRNKQKNIIAWDNFDVYGNQNMHPCQNQQVQYIQPQSRQIVSPQQVQQNQQVYRVPSQIQYQQVYGAPPQNQRQFSQQDDFYDESYKRNKQMPFINNEHPVQIV